MTRKIFFLLIAISFLFLTSCSDEKKEQSAATQAPPEPPPLPVEYFMVEQDDIPIWLEFTGKTEATKRIEVRARVAGQLEEILFKEGEYVEKGAKLFKIEPDTYEAALEKAKAALDGDKASLALAKADVKRYEPLVAEGLAPRVTLEQNQARVGELEAAIKSDFANIRDAELNLSYTTVVAPISGRLSRTQVDVGNIVGYGEKTVLTTMVADDPMFAYFSPAESDFQIMRKYKIQKDMEARVRVPGEMKGLIDRIDYKGVVGFSDNIVDRNTGTITMRAKVANPEHDLMEGTFVYVDVFITDKAQLLMVTPAAVQEDQRGSFIYVIDDENKAKRIDINRGFETRNYLVVNKGIKVGDKVIISGLAKIREGRKLDATDVTGTKGVLAQLKKQDMIPTK